MFIAMFITPLSFPLGRGRSEPQAQRGKGRIAIHSTSRTSAITSDTHAILPDTRSVLGENNHRYPILS